MTRRMAFSWATWRRAWPYLVVALAFVVSRLVYHAVYHVRFDHHPVDYFIQYVDPWFLRHDFARTILYLHHQAPLQNVLVGVFLRLAEPTLAYALLEGLYVGLGFLTSLGLLHAALRLGARPLASAFVVSLFAVSPTTVLYENWLFVHLPVTCCLVLSLVALSRYYRLGTTWGGLAFFGMIAVAALFRSSLGPLFLAIIVGLVLLKPPRVQALKSARKTVLRAAALPLLVLTLNSWKPRLLIGADYGEAMFWGNLVNKIFYRIPAADRQRLLNDGVLSPAATLFCLTDLAFMEGLRQPHPPTGVPILDMERAPSGRWNAHAFEYVLIARKYFKPDALYLVSYQTGYYLESMWHAFRYHFISSARDSELWHTPNYARILPLLDRVDKLSGSGSSGRPLTLVIGLPLLAAYGLRRLFGARARCESQRYPKVAIGYMLLTIFYVTGSTVVVSCGDWNRYRFDINPFYIALFLLLLSDLGHATRILARRGLVFLSHRRGSRHFRTEALALGSQRGREEREGGA